MIPTWTGKAGEPVPEALRHALTPCGERQRHCAGCGGYWWVEDGLPGERELCPGAVASRVTALERDRDDVIVRLGRLVQTDAQRLVEVDLIRREMRDATDAVDSMSARLYQRTAEVERLTREMESIRVRCTDACKGTGLSPSNAGIVPEIVAILADRLRASAARIAELEAHEASLHKAADRVRGEIVRWLEHVARTSMGHAHEVSRQAFAFSARIERGDDIRWCEAHPVSPAPAGADAGRDPGREE